MDTPTSEPASLQAGDTLRWQIALTAYPASNGWALAYRLSNAVSKVDITSAANGDDHLVDIPASTSAAYPPGDYTATRYVTRGAERHTLPPVTMRIVPDIAAMAGGFDARSPAQRALEDLRAALRQWLSTSGVVQDYSIAGRAMRFVNADEIRKRIALAQSEVNAELAAQGQRPASRRLYVRF